MHYNSPIVRPQTDANDLFIELTVGCTHNSCTFCNFYDGYPFRVADWKQIEEDLQEAAAVYPHTTKVWATGGNPFALSVDNLKRFADLTKEYLPEARIGTYARVNDLYHKSAEEIHILHEAGYDNIVLGIESADDDVLSHVKKGYTAEDILRECKKLEEAGMPYRIIYLGGLAGAGNGEESARRTAAVLNQLHPYYMFLTTVAILPGTKLHQEMLDGTFKEETELERLKEFRRLIQDMKNPIGVFSATSTDVLAFTAHFPEDKDKVLKKFDKAISTFSAEDEAYFNARRHAMRSV
ncbi:radical SAM protein [Dehalobacterium formicoaceticum]|uniref:Radical SAM protein n=1 Tax=Dehalobacterium formicoaceticum TaxID=51515 RepID=A0ABT1Y7W7_9FIRM|nr:radical SAM protein [Dehalobacterium formicoaceticum]MCR6546980.1 radical SAM protein [Dehalobacterium formicoaceticum]